MSGRIGRALRMSPLALARRLVRETQIASEEASRRKSDALNATHSHHTPETLASLLSGIPVAEGGDGDSRAVELYCEHKFDLLGSGWTNVSYGMTCAGLEGVGFAPSVAPLTKADPNALMQLVNDSNLREARRLWSLLPADYRPIDWQLDFRSGYRWDARTWYRDVRFANVRGADIKLPWELSRMQHLPQIAAEYGRTRSPELSAEFRNQVLDWMATNPPRFGVNWYSTMDVAIRAANLLVAYDMFLSYGVIFDYDFDCAFRRSIRDHSVHILENLEWTETLRGNHYLADITGLIFCATYLPRTDETDSWLTFCDAELHTAVSEQFNADGSNFEASTCYHRLSAEMVTYAAALLDLGGERLTARGDPVPLRDRIRRMGEFTAVVTKPNGNVWQVGDNDSGRFFKISPVFSGHGNTDPAENHLDHAHLRESIDVFLHRDAQPARTSSINAEMLVMDSIRAKSADARVAGEGSSVAGVEITNNSPLPKRGPPDATRVRTIDLPEGAADSLHTEASPFFGVYVLRGPQLFVGVRCGPVGQNGIGGHAHNDQLAIEVNVAGEDWIADPGTYLYTPLPEHRNAYRRTSAHSAPCPLGLEQAGLESGLFRLDKPWVGQCISFNADGFIGEIRKGGKAIRREVSILRGRITVTDSAWGCELAPDAPTSIPFSPGYGIRELDGQT